MSFKKKIIPFVFSIFIFPDIDWNFSQPSGIFVEKGRVYVADSGNSIIKVFSPSGKLVLEIEGIEEDKFECPHDVLVDSSSDIYISDTWNNRVCVFDKKGRWKKTIGGFGEGCGRFNKPHSISIDTDDSLYVVDSGNGIIQKFAKDGSFVMELGREVGLKFPSGIAIDNETIYVSDSYNNRIVKFNKEGKFIGSIDNIDNPRGIVVSSGILYIAETGGGRILKLIDKKIIPFIKNLNMPYDIAFDKEFLWITEAGKNRLLKFDIDGIFKEEWKGRGSGLSRLNLPYDISVSNDCDIYIADCGNNRILWLDQSFKPKGVWNVDAPISIFVDNRKDVYCINSIEKQIIKFDKKGNEVCRWQENLVDPKDLFVTEKGVFVVDSSKEWVFRFSNDGKFIGTICSGLKEACGIAIDSLGYIIVSDCDGIKRFSRMGILVKKMDGFSSPSGVTVDKDDNIYVVDKEDNEIIKLSFYGKILDKIKAKFSFPQSIAIDKEGCAYIVDTGNHRIVKIDFSDRVYEREPIEIEIKPTKTNFPDFVVDEIIIDEPRKGVWTKISSKIRNCGDKQVDFVSVSMYEDSKRIGLTKIIKTIPPKATEIISTIWYPEKEGICTIRVVVDQEDMIREENEDNNIGEKEVFVW
ncbi:TPA: hypothetical protein DCX16_06975 [bacterium]|nr:hypothetical protein [bacterium]